MGVRDLARLSHQSFAVTAAQGQSRRARVLSLAPPARRKAEQRCRWFSCRRKPPTRRTRRMGMSTLHPARRPVRVVGGCRMCPDRQLASRPNTAFYDGCLTRRSWSFWNSRKPPTTANKETQEIARKIGKWIWLVFGLISSWHSV